ncbi:MAG: ribonuclease III [Dehalococcoidia bacterium]|nr:ribonuclease III [Dehalococcoidia bacterium]
MAKRSSTEKHLGLRFKNDALLREALVHSSYVNENPELAPASNERLEFLGDAVLGLIVADQLFASYPDQDEGMLTELRSHLVRRDTLAKAARRLQLGAALLLGRGEEAGGGRSRPTNLAHAYEAVVGAIFLDGGLAAARRFVQRSLKPEFEELTERAYLPDPKSRLQVLSQSQFQSTPQYRLVEAKGPDHARRFTVEVVVAGRPLGTGAGRSKQQAEKEAAREALGRLQQQAAETKTGTSNSCT